MLLQLENIDFVNKTLKLEVGSWRLKVRESSSKHLLKFQHQTSNFKPQIERKKEHEFKRKNDRLEK